MKRSVITIIALICTFLLVLAAGVLPLIGGTRALGLNQPGGNFNGRQPQGSFPEGMTLPDGVRPGDGQDFQPPSGRNGQMPGGGNFTPGNGTQGQFNQASMKLMQLLEYGVGGTVLLLGVLAMVGLWMNKKWGKVLTILTAATVLASSIPSLFRTMWGGWNTLAMIVKVVFSIAAVILVLIPVKKTVVPESVPPAS